MECITTRDRSQQYQYAKYKEYNGCDNKRSYSGLCAIIVDDDFTNSYNLCVSFFSFTSLPSNELARFSLPKLFCERIRNFEMRARAMRVNNSLYSTFSFTLLSQSWNGNVSLTLMSFSSKP